MRQKFYFGDVVRIAADLGPSMRHFRADCDAVVIGSYLDLHGRVTQGSHAYCLLFQDGNPLSWYKEDQLALIRHGGPEAVEAWRAITPQSL